MRSWVFRNRARLEAIYGSPGRHRALTVADERPSAPAPDGGRARRLLLYALRPWPRPVSSERRAG